MQYIVTFKASTFPLSSSSLLSLLPSDLFCLQTSTPAPLTGLSARTTAASHCAGFAMATTTVAMTRTSPTPPAQVRKQSEFTPTIQPNWSLFISSWTCSGFTCAFLVWTVELMFILLVQPWMLCAPTFDVISVLYSYFCSLH